LTVGAALLWGALGGFVSGPIARIVRLILRAMFHAHLRRWADEADRAREAGL
jgi:hypothetical protein